MKILNTYFMFVVVFASLFFYDNVWADAQMYYIDLSQSSQTVSIKSELEDLAWFYSFNLVSFESAQSVNFISEFKKVKPYVPVAIIVNITSPTIQGAEETVEKILKDLPERIPLMFVTLPVESGSDLLSNISDGIITGLRLVDGKGYFANFQGGRKGRFLGEFSGQTVSTDGFRMGYFNLIDENRTRAIATVSLEDTAIMPFLLDVQLKSGRRLFAVLPRPDVNYKNDPGWGWKSYLLTLLPSMGFIKYSFGEWIWHNERHLVNLTIDDPILVETYGFIEYDELLRNLKLAGFHATIALIPWNYNRYEEKVVNLFKNNPDFLSLAVHGNNHDHYEFYSDPNEEDLQKFRRFEKNIRNSIIRMNQFSEVTGLDYDRSMIFPHNIGDEKSLEFLRKNNFLATFNTNRLPIGSEAPQNLFYYLKTYYPFSGIPSVGRFGPEQLSAFDVAAHLFLDNPIVYSTHHDYFQAGMNRFNPNVEMIKLIDPNAEWSNLGEIAKNLFLIKRYDEQSFDVMAFSRKTTLRNHSDVAAKYRVFFNSPSDTGNDKADILSIAQPKLLEEFFLAPNEEKSITLWIEEEPKFRASALKKDGIRIYILRYLSEFRDSFMWKYPVTRAMAKIYYRTGIFRLGLIMVFLSIIIFSFALYAIVWSLKSWVKKNRHKNSKSYFRF